MPRRKFNDGQELINSDLSAVSSSLEIELYERLLFNMLNRQEDFCFDDSFSCAYTTSSTVTVAAGVGMQTDGTQTDPEPKKRMLYLAAASVQSISTPDASNPRIDIISIKANRATAASSSRKYKDIVGTISTVSQVVETDWASDLLVTAGTPGVSPSAPSTPAGYIKLCEITVAAVTGIAGAASVVDKRPQYKRPASWRSVVTKTAAYTAVPTDEVILANATGGAFSVTLPPAALCIGKTLLVKKTDSSANAVTLDGNASEQLDGSLTQSLDYQYSALEIFCDGTQWHII